MAKSRLEQWIKATNLYRDATKAGLYKPEYDPMKRESLEKVEKLTELLKAFFDVQNPEWQALRKLMLHSGKDVVVKSKETSDLVIWYVLGKSGFRLEFDLRGALEWHRHPEDRRPIMRRKISPKDMARFLVDEWERQCGTAEDIFERLLQKVDRLAMAAPFAPHPDDDLY